MTDQELKRYIEESDLSFQHFGVLVKDIDKAKEVVSLLPGIGEWYIPGGEGELILGDKNNFVRSSCKFKTLSTNLFGNIEMEFVIPDMEHCKNTTFEDYFNENETGGMHHYSCNVPDLGRLRIIMRELLERGYEAVLHARFSKEQKGFEDKPDGWTLEFCYLKPPYGGLYFELNWQGSVPEEYKEWKGL